MTEKEIYAAMCSSHDAPPTQLERDLYTALLSVTDTPVASQSCCNALFQHNITQTILAIAEAGGSPEVLLGMTLQEAIETLSRNGVTVNMSNR